MRKLELGSKGHKLESSKTQGKKGSSDNKDDNKRTWSRKQKALISNNQYTFRK